MSVNPDSVVARVPAVSVIIATCNRATSLVKTLQSLAEMDLPPGLEWELIVVDNNSTDGTREVIKRFASSSALNVQYMFEPTQGQSRALNTGIRAARGEVVAFTDDDVKVEAGWLRQLWQAFERHECVGVGGRIVADWSIRKPAWLQENGPYRMMAAIVQFDLGEERCDLDTRTAPFGANLALRRCALDTHGLFREDLGPGAGGLAAGADTDLCRRIMSRGGKFVYIPQAVVFHPVEAHRATRSYYKSWYFRFGRAEMRRDAWPEAMRCLLGVPRHLFRTFARDAIRWVLTTNRKRRFYYKLQLYKTAGLIWEAHNLTRMKVRPAERPSAGSSCKSRGPQ